LEHGRQTGWGEQHVERDLTVEKHTALAGPDICGGDKQLYRRLTEPLEVDAFRKNLPQRVEPSGIQIVRREQPRHHVRRDEDGRMVQTPTIEQHVEKAAAEWAQQRCSRYVTPEHL
jgi:hypothetical protein